MNAWLARLFYRLVSRNTVIPLTLGLRNIYILPTGYGLLYLAVLVGMLIGSTNYNNNLGFLLTFLLGSLGLVAMLYTYAMLYGLRLGEPAARPVFAGQFMEIGIRVQAGGRTRTGLRWYFDPAKATEADVPPGPPVQICIPARTQQRGHFAPGRLYITCSYPLGLFKAWARLDPHVRAMVYPQPLPGPVPAAETGLGEGEGQDGGKPGVEDFQGLKAYQPGDPPQRIHWQSWSRGRGLHVKDFSGQSGLALMLDLSRAAGGLEHRLSVLCFHVLRAHRQGRRFGLTLGPRLLSVGEGEAHLRRCLEALSLYGDA